MWGVSWPDYAPVDSILAIAHTRKNEELYDTYVKKHKEHLELKDYLYEIYVKKEDTNNLLSYIDLVQNAEEIHCINSSLFHLIDSLPNTTNQLYYHNIRKHSCHFEISYKWSTIQYV